MLSRVHAAGVAALILLALPVFASTAALANLQFCNAADEPIITAYSLTIAPQRSYRTLSSVGRVELTGWFRLEPRQCRIVFAYDNSRDEVSFAWAFAENVSHTRMWRGQSLGETDDAMYRMCPELRPERRANRPWEEISRMIDMCIQRNPNLLPPPPGLAVCAPPQPFRHTIPFDLSNGSREEIAGQIRASREIPDIYCGAPGRRAAYFFSIDSLDRSAQRLQDYYQLAANGRRGSAAVQAHTRVFFVLGAAN